MLILNDSGDALVNSDQVMAFAIQQTPQGAALVAFGLGVTSPLAVGSNARVDQGLQAITKGIKTRQHFLDLRDVLGARPELTVAQNALLVPGNGQKP